MIAIADGGGGGVTLSIFYGSTFYGSNYRSQVQADRQADRLQAGSSQAQVRQSGSSQAQ